MPNSIVTDVVGSVVIEKLSKILAPFTAFATDCDAGSSEDGGNVIVAGVSPPTVKGAEFGGSYATGADSNLDKVSVSLKHYYSSFYLTDKEFNSSSANRLATLIGSKANALGGFLTDELTKVITATNYTGPVTKTNASYDIATIKSLKKSLDGKGAPLDDRAIVLSTEVSANILPTEVETLGSSTFTEGAVQRAYGANVYQTNSLDDTNNLNSFMAHRSAIAIASRVPKVQDSSSLIDVATFEIPNLGLNIQYKSFMDNLTNRHYGVLETLAGSSKGSDLLVWTKSS